MDLVIGIMFLIIAIAIILLIYALQRKDESMAPVAGAGALCLVLICGGLNLIDEYCNPSITPIDVYRGETTLEITYRDSIAIDSTVVWKEE